MGQDCDEPAADSADKMKRGCYTTGQKDRERRHMTIINRVLLASLLLSPVAACAQTAATDA